jgi:hypothetical protein
VVSAKKKATKKDDRKYVYSSPSITYFESKQSNDSDEWGDIVASEKKKHTKKDNRKRCICLLF